MLTKLTQPLAAVLLLCSVAYADVQWTDLRKGKVKLPYNSKVIIRGKLSEIKIENKPLTGFISVDSVGVKYSTSPTAGGGDNYTS